MDFIDGLVNETNTVEYGIQNSVNSDNKRMRQKVVISLEKPVVTEWTSQFS